jgi:hypothetical protein
MRRLLLVLLIPIVSQFGVHYFRIFAKAIGEASVNQWKQVMVENIEKEFPRE